MVSQVEMRIVGDDEDGMRLDRWFRAHYPQLRHGALEKLLRTGQIRVDGGRVKSNRRLAIGEEIRIPPITDAPVQKETPKSARHDPGAADLIGSLTIYEDDDILAINKPFGLPVQGGIGAQRNIDAMLGALEKNGERPRLVHRLDKDTGGLFITAKTRKAAQALSRLFQTRNVEKTYWALTMAVPQPRQGTINLPIAKRRIGEGRNAPERMTPDNSDEAKYAITDYQVLDSAGPTAFVALKPLTGRTHQLRVHMAAIETPIIGDGKYGGRAAHLEGVSPKLHLFCRSMCFPHPSTGRRLELVAPLTGHMAESWAFFAFDKEAICEWPDFKK